MTPGRSHFVSDRFTRHLRRKHDQSLSRAPDPASKQDSGLSDSYNVVTGSQKSPSLRQQIGQPEAPCSHQAAAANPNGTNRIQSASPNQVAVKSEDNASVNSRLRGLSVEEHPSDSQPGLLIGQSTPVVVSNKRPAEYDNTTHPKTRTRRSNPAQANQDSSIPLAHRAFEPEDSRANTNLPYSSDPYVTRQNSRTQGKSYSSTGENANAAAGRDPEKGLLESPIESSPPSKDTEFNILLQPETRAITHEQLINEVKGIYAGLVMVEKKCVEIDGQQASSTNKLSHEQYQALIALHRTLLHEHHDFFLASQHPSASPSLRKLATRYAMPARMWRHGIHSFLELLRHRLPGSLDHMLAFVYLSYSMVALLKESVPSFEETWIECLGDLARYRMAIEEADLRDREVWAGVARMWYNQAADRSPNVGRIQHHLAVLARPNIVQQLFYYSKALVSLTPFQNARESIMLLFNQFLDSPETVSQRYPTVEASLVHAAALLFSRGSMSIFDEAANQFVSSLDPYIGRVTAKFRVQGPEIACGLLAMLMDFGIVDSVIWQAVRALDVPKKQSQDSSQESPNQVEVNTEDPTVGQIERQLYWKKNFDIRVIKQISPSLIIDPMDDSTTFTSSEEVVNRAGNLFRKSTTVILQRIGDKNCLPFAHVILAFLYSLSFAPDVLLYVEAIFPWTSLALFLNTLGRSGTVEARFEGSEFPMLLSGIGRQLPEDFTMRGLAWTKYFYPPGFFEGQVVDEDERALEPPSMAAPRAERCLWLGIQLASCGRWLQYDNQTKDFSVTEYARSLETSAKASVPAPRSQTLSMEREDVMMVDVT